MAEPLHERIIQHLKGDAYSPAKPRRIAHQLDVADDENYAAFRNALRELMHEGRVVLGASGTVVLPTQRGAENEFVGTYRQNRRGFGFVVPREPDSHEDLYIPEGENGGAITGDIVRARITSTGRKEGKAIYSGRIVEIIERTQKRFVGELNKIASEWIVLPDGNTLKDPILTPDAASRHIKPGTKVVVELTSYPERMGQRAQGVITEVLGKAGEKDVDLKSVIVQFNLPGPFPEAVQAEARQAIDRFDPNQERAERLDLTNEIICTIDPDDAKDYDDAISLKQLDNGYWELGVHIADVSFFVPQGSALDEEAKKRGNSAYFPGHVIPMLPEILSNGVCSLQEAVPRLCKSAFIVYDDDARPVSARFANTIIKSAKRLRYREAQAILHRTPQIPHPDGPRTIADYDPKVVVLLDEMNTLALRLQKRRQAQGQVVLELPETELVLNEEGKVIDAVPEDQSFTHTLIEMFMVEANEAVARLFDSLDVPFLRRIHPEPDTSGSERLRHFVEVAGYKLPKTMDRKALQALLASVKGRPESFAINLAVLKSLSRAEYSPQSLGHYALASEHYCHFTSPIRRYADLTIHRLLDSYFEAQARQGQASRKKKLELDGAISYDDLVELGRHISFTERRADDAERELRQVKILELLAGHVGDEFAGVVTGITNFGIFVQLQTYLNEGLIRYEDLLDDWWDVDERGGVIRGQRTGTRIGVGDPVKVIVVKVDPARRELVLAVTELRGGKRSLRGEPSQNGPKKSHKKQTMKSQRHQPKQPQHGGQSRRSRHASGKRRRGR